jgi:solute:Na+ symporter, SSS family
MTMGRYDYLVLTIYLGFMASLGLVFRKFNRDSSDYFRLGGHATWWMVGATAFMTQFSSWTFTGAASKAYTDGILVLAIYVGNAVGYFVAYRWSAVRYRQMRVITPVEGIRDRFGSRNEQFFTWISIPLGLFYAAIWLNAMSTFASAIFDVDPRVTIVAVGLVVLVIASLGGGGAVMASDFIQMMILFPVSILTAVLALQTVGHGSTLNGVTRLAERITTDRLFRPDHSVSLLIALWIAATIVKQICTTNSMNDAHRFLMAIDSRAARRAALMASILFLVGPIIWFVPPMAAAILYPDLSVVPQLTRLGGRLTEGAYVAIGLTTMPAGMIGLMAAAIFGVTLSSMDVGLNKSAGIFVRDVYKPLIRPLAEEGEYLRVGQLTSVLCGLLVIAAALLVQTASQFRLFDVMMLFSAMVVVPVAVPLIWGTIVTRSPDWSAWSTVCVGVLTSMVCPSIVNMPIVQRLVGVPPSTRNLADLLFVTSLFLNVIVGSLWFLGSCCWARHVPDAVRRRQEGFAERLRTPVIADASPASRQRSAAIVGSLATVCWPYGVLVSLFAFVPNAPAGRISFVLTGAFLVAVGLLLRHSARSLSRARPTTTAGAVPEKIAV